MAERQYCSDLCADAAEPMLGTADRVDVWLLLEYKPTWRRKATADNELAEPVARWLDATVEKLAAAGLKARPQFIRRPEIDTLETHLLIGADGGCWRFASVGYDDIVGLDVAAALEADMGGFDRVDQAQYFVCTNGQRDLCCARYGLPVYAELRELAGERVWQTTHVGGHRFAPNVLTLPQGALYGRVVPDEVAGFVATIEAGQLSISHLRGRSAFAPPVQAAEAILGGRAGSLVAFDGDDAAGEARFQTAEGEIRVAVERSVEPMLVLASCKDDTAKPMYPYFGRVL